MAENLTNKVFLGGCQINMSNDKMILDSKIIKSSKTAD